MDEGVPLGGHITLLDRIGEGATGVVYKGYDQIASREVAIKVIDTEAVDESTVRRFIREATVPLSLEHPNLVKVHDSFSDPNFIALIMEYVSGPTLNQLIGSYRILGSYFPLNLVLAYTRQIGSGLAYLHDHGLVHRDLKPANIIIDNKQKCAKVTDFGLLKVLEDLGLTKTEDVIGTPRYMAPELLGGGAKHVDRLIDIYGLGLLTKEMLIGDFAIRYRKQDAMPALLVAIMQGYSHTLFEMRGKGDHALPADLIRPLEDIISKAMAVDPTKRYQDVGSFLDDFTTVTKPYLL